MAEVESGWLHARFQRDDRMAEGYADRIFAREADAESRPALRVLVKGTAFQVRVWRALVRLPQGALASYGCLAAALEMPRSARAVGTAVGQNSVAYLIPCHRVIRETGVAGKYRWGDTRKRAMLAWESSLRPVIA